MLCVYPYILGLLFVGIGCWKYNCWVKEFHFFFLILTGFAIFLFQGAEVIYISVVYGSVHSCILISIVLILIQLPSLLFKFYTKISLKFSVFLMVGPSFLCVKYSHPRMYLTTLSPNSAVAPVPSWSPWWASLLPGAYILVFNGIIPWSSPPPSLLSSLPSFLYFSFSFLICAIPC